MSNCDSTATRRCSGLSPNGTYTFGGGAAYSPVEIQSASGLHDIHAGDPLPDSLTGFLTGTPFSYTTAAAPTLFAQGEHMGDSAVRREAYNFFFQDTWKVSAAPAELWSALRSEYTHQRGRPAHFELRFEQATDNQVDPRAARRGASVPDQYPAHLQQRLERLGDRASRIEWRIKDKTTFGPAAQS